MKKTMLGVLLATVFVLTAQPARAADGQTELDNAAAYVLENSIMVGDQNGDLNLNAGLNRTELAVLLTRLCEGTADVQINSLYYEGYCGFTDVPDWAKPYVGFCVNKSLLTGYDATRYGAADPVTPAAACSVILRASGIPDGSAWDYSTACSYAAGLGWIDTAVTHVSAMTRGDMAILIYRAMTGIHPAASTAIAPSTGDGYLTNGKPVTEENVLDILLQLEKDWPNGTIWGTHNTPGTFRNEIPSTASQRVMDTYPVSSVYGCSGYAAMISSLIFGDTANPARPVEDLLQVRPGDILFYVSNNDGHIWHVIIALESPSEIHAFHYTDGNSGERVHWPDRQKLYGRENLDCFGENRDYHLEAWTRYPENVPYTGNSVGAWATGPET